MTSQHDKAKRWRPRFSIRTLVIVLTLVCAYFGGWKITKQRAGHDVATYANDVDGIHPVDGHCCLPFIFAIAWGGVDPNYVPPVPRGSGEAGGGRLYWTHYFWFFGFVAKLPYERELRSHSDSQVRGQTGVQVSRYRGGFV